ncbi:9-O-acetylesterase [Verrucomicrobiota bacterium]|nr:9-O-acetylesterase [Verrucomicrobiota bacterium]
MFTIHPATRSLFSLTRLSLLTALLAALTFSPHASAQPTGPQPWWPVQPRALPFLHPLFTSDMVMQRDLAAPIWGWAKPGDKITVQVDGKAAAEAVAGADGRWAAKVGPFAAGGPHTVVVEGGGRKESLTNVLFGDVWLCTGQSNMNWPVRLSQNAEEEVKAATNANIRSFTVNFYSSFAPEQLPPAARWEPCTPEFAKNFTAVGYFFAREIQAKVGVPIGLIHSSAGATAAEAWVSAEALRRDMPYDFRERLDELDKTNAFFGANFEFFRAVEQWTAKVDPPSAAKEYASDPNLDTSDWLDIAVPKPWEETGIAELKDFDGMVWFRHTVDIPATWSGKDLLLVLSVVHDADVVWFNGTVLGSKGTPGLRNYLVDASLVKPGKNLLAAAIVNAKGPGGFCSHASNITLRPAVNPGTNQVRIAGTWKAKRGPAFADLPAPFPIPRVGHYKTIASLYNGMIAPLVPYGIKGALWYQGEANGPFWLQYRRLLPTLIADWRQRFAVGDFPFLIVSLANLNAEQTKPIEPGWAEIRESQWRTARTVPNTGLAMTIDIGNPKDIHPRNKQEVGRRLSLVARKLVYGETNLVHSGPEFTEMQVELPKGDKVRLYFKNVGSGLMIRPGDKKLTGFVCAGFDRNWAWADAVIEGNTVVISSPEVPEPKYVRYGWAWNPIVNLYNKEGLPAITFRTDE